MPRAKKEFASDWFKEGALKEPEPIIEREGKEKGIKWKLSNAPKIASFLSNRIKKSLF